MITTFVTVVLIPMLLGWLAQFWGWIVAAGAAILAFLFSPEIRKFTITILAALIVLASTYFYAYNKGFDAPHPVTPPACTDFAKHLVSGPATTKAIGIFKRNHLCI